VGRGAAGNRRSGTEVKETVALILDTDDEIFIAADAADMAKQLVGLLYGGRGTAERRTRAERRHQDHLRPREAGRDEGVRTMSDQNINIKLDRGGPENHAWTVLGPLLACGAVGMAAWAISNAGALDLAATGL